MPGYDPSGSKGSTGGHSLANKNATPQNRNNNRLNPGAAGATSAGGGAKETFTTICYGNNHATICFGQISKMGDVTGDVLIQASVGDHH